MGWHGAAWVGQGARGPPASSSPGVPAVLASPTRWSKAPGHLLRPWPMALLRASAPLHCLPPKPEQRHRLGATPRLWAVSKGGPTRAQGSPGCFIGGLGAGGPVAGGIAAERGHAWSSPLLLQPLIMRGTSWYSLTPASALAQAVGSGESPPSPRSGDHASQPRSLRASLNCPYFR